MSGETYPISRLMAVVAHPDDAEFFCGGTLARMAAGGKETTLVIVTSGATGGDGAIPGVELARTRESEAREAAQLLGLHHVTFLRHADSEVSPSLELRRDIVREIRRYRPELVITHNPIRHFGHGNHPDHLAVGEATFAAVEPTSANPMAYPEMAADGLSPWQVEWVFAFNAEQPNHYEDIGATLEVKVRALGCHRSQRVSQVGDVVRMLAREHAAVGVNGDRQMQFAEPFRKVFTVSPRRLRTDGIMVPG